MATDLAKVRRFENGLKLSIRGRIVGLRLQDMDSMVGTALTIERVIEGARSTLLGIKARIGMICRGCISCDRVGILVRRIHSLLH